MASTFEQRFQDGPLERLLEHFAETVTYTPKGGSAQSISAIIERERRGATGPLGQARIVWKITVWISAADVAMVTPGGDTISLAEMRGDSTNKTFTVKDVIDQRGGAWRLQVQ
jgi:hypothetical protein